MPIPNSDQLNTRRNLRTFFQPGGPASVNKVLYAGQDSGYMKIEGVKIPQLGGLEPMFIHDPHRIGSYIQTATMIKPPALPTIDITFLEKRGGIPFLISQPGCRFTAYEPVGVCKDPGNFLSGFEQYVMIYPDIQVIDIDLGNRTGFNEDESLMDKASCTLARRQYAVGPMNFGPTAGGVTLANTTVVDAVYGSQIGCGANCGINNDGSKVIYAVTQGATAAPPNLFYTLDGGGSWTSVPVAAMANAENPSAIDIVGDKLVIVSKTAGSATQGGYYYAQLDAVTGIPSTFTKVTAGFIATTGKAPNDLLVLSPSEIYFCGDGGTIYRSTDITAGVSVLQNASATSANLLRISGTSEALVATGSTSSVIVSLNRGAAWSVPASVPVTGSIGITGVFVLNKNSFWIGTDTGLLFSTYNGGQSWNAVGFSGSGTGKVWDIQFSTPEVGFFSHSNATPTARVFGTWNGGQAWSNQAPRINGLTTLFNVANRIAVPGYASDGIASNNLFISGTAASGTDGIALLGNASVL